MKRVTKTELKQMRELNAYALVRYYCSGNWVSKFISSKYEYYRFVAFLTEITICDFKVSFNHFYKKN